MHRPISYRQRAADDHRMMQQLSSIRSEKHGCYGCVVYARQKRQVVVVVVENEDCVSVAAAADRLTGTSSAALKRNANRITLSRYSRGDRQFI